jgi:hypothetical protein
VTLLRAFERDAAPVSNGAAQVVRSLPQSAPGCSVSNTPTVAAENRLSLLNESTSHALIFEKISFGTKTFLKD